MRPIGPSNSKELLVLKLGNDVLFQEPTVSARRLRRSVVVAVGEDSISVCFVGEPSAFAVDQDVLMYFTGKREFMQQIGKIREIEAPAAPVDAAEPAAKEGPVFVIEPVGDPISAEARQHYRVSTISAGIEARMGPEADLQVQDLSATGFAVLAEQQYKIGQVIKVAIRHGEEACHGLVSVQSFRELESGRLRYGLRAIEKDPHAMEFMRTLQRISLAVQREQLQRSGAER
jgi:hypothetical protein